MTQYRMRGLTTKGARQSRHRLSVQSGQHRRKDVERFNLHQYAEAVHTDGLPLVSVIDCRERRNILSMEVPALEERVAAVVIGPRLIALQGTKTDTNTERRSRNKIECHWVIDAIAVDLNLP